MADWIPDAKPDWWGTVQALGTRPIDFVLGIVWAALATELINGTEFVIGVVIDAFTVIVDVFDLARTTLVGAIRPIGMTLLELPWLVVGLVGTIERAAGPAAPFILVPGAILVALAAWRVLEATATFIAVRG